MRITVVTRQKPDRAGTLPLYVRIAQHGKDRYVSLGLRVPAKDWNPKKREVRKGSPHAVHLNGIVADALATSQAAAHGVFASGLEPTPNRLKAAVEAALSPEPEEGAPVLIRDYCAARVERTFKTMSASTAYFQQRSYRAWEESHPGLAFSEVTPALVHAHVAYLQGPKSEGGRALAPNTVYGNLSALKAMARAAERDGVPGAGGMVRALLGVKLKQEKTAKPRLTLEQVHALERLDWSTDKDLPGGYGETARDAFVFSFYAGGMRWSDVCTLRWADLERGDSGAFETVAIRQRKSGELSRLPLLGSAPAVLEKWWARTGPEGATPGPYVFGFVSDEDFPPPVGSASKKHLRHVINRRASLVRQHLYEIQARTGLPRVGFHGARNSFADHMRKRGAGLYSISKALGHSSLKVTEVYLSRFDYQSVETEMRRVFDGDEG